MPDIPLALAAALSARYRIERELGAGGMARVYLARDLKHDRDVALKVLSDDVAAGVSVDRFLAEIRTTARLKHPHILPLFDSGSADGALFYVMPFVEGESLDARIRRSGPLPIVDAVRILREVADDLS
jgi:serine/threonine protein kinase